MIMLAFYGMVFLGALSELQDMELRRIFCAGFFLSRTLSGIGVVSLQSAKQEGLLFQFADSAQKTQVRVSLYIQCILAAGFMIYQSAAAGILAVGAAFLTFWYYAKKSRKELGGITGDTAGFFVTICELFITLSLAGFNII